jgi:hypothetical protein
MQRSEAEKILAHVLELYSSIGSIDETISGLESDSEKRRLVAALGNILRISREEIMLPIFSDYPDLMPETLGGKTP